MQYPQHQHPQPDKTPRPFVLLVDRPNRSTRRTKLLRRQFKTQRIPWPSFRSPKISPILAHTQQKRPKSGHRFGAQKHSPITTPGKKTSPASPKNMPVRPHAATAPMPPQCPQQDAQPRTLPVLGFHNNMSTRAAHDPNSPAYLPQQRHSFFAPPPGIHAAPARAARESAAPRRVATGVARDNATRHP